VHCHLLPGIDDGAPDEATALAMARAAVADGITGALLTPHHLNGSYANGADRISKAFEDYQRLLEREKIPLKIHPGCEVHMSPDLLERLDAGEVMTLGSHGRYILLEFPPMLPPPNTRQILFGIQRRGLGIILAHPERIAPFASKPDTLDELIDAGALVQLTASSLTGQWGPEGLKLCKRLLNERRVHFIASDAHNLGSRRPALTEARRLVEKWHGERAAELLFETNPRALAEGGEIMQ
jgi:protein-tyrosine phosphatase